MYNVYYFSETCPCQMNQIILKTPDNKLFHFLILKGNIKAIKKKYNAFCLKLVKLTNKIQRKG